MTAGASISVRDLVKRFEVKRRRGDDDGVVAVDHVSIEVPAGQCVAFVGPSGSGKSTLFHLVGALDNPDEGEIEVNGADVTALGQRELVAYRRTVGFVFQGFHLIPSLSAVDNVLTPLVPVRVKHKAALAQELLDLVGLSGRHGSLPAELSGGEQQRVAIARALVNHPSLLLADEPTGNLDQHTGAEIVDLLLRLREEFGSTVLVATHDPAIAARCDRIVRLRDGAVVDDVTLDGRSDATADRLARFTVG